MQPACQHLSIFPGTTYRDTVRLMQPAFAYRPITAISGAPVRLNVPTHGLVGAWPVWVRGVTGMPALNVAPVQQQPHRALVIDANTLEINALSGAGLQPRGGELIYRLPVDLDGATISARLLDASGALLLAIPAAVIGRGTVELELTDEQTAALSPQVASWTLDVEQGGDVYRAITGQARVWPAGSMPPCDGNGWITVGGSQGPRGADGANVTAAEVDPDGYLVLTMSDHSVIRSAAPVNRPWGTIIGDISDQTDLMELLGDLEDSIPTAPADIGAATAAQGELADTAVQPDEIADVVRDAELESGLAGKVDKVAGKGLSTEDYTTAEKSKLAGIEAGAQVNAVTSVAGKTGAVTLAKGDVGLGNVDNTSDTDKPVSTATATALAGKLDATATAADSSRLGGQLPSYYATAAQIGDIDAALDLINGEVI